MASGFGEPASIFTVIRISDKIISLCGEYTLAVKNAKRDVERLTNEVRAFLDVLKKVEKIAKGLDASKLLASELVSGAIKECSSELNNLIIRLDPGTGRKVMKRVGFRALKWPFTSKDLNEIIESIERYKGIINMALHVDQIEDLNQLSQGFAGARLDILPCAEGAAFNSRLWEHEPQCLPETRVEVLQRIMTWSEDPGGSCIFWLNGMAGTGKSTIARTVARDFDKTGRLGASFFFSRGRGDLGHAAKFFTSIATQLANTLPSVKQHISTAVVDSYNICEQGLGEQWKRLIFQPLSRLDDTSLQSQIWILVFDALDECESENDIKLIIQLLTQVKDLNAIRLRVFVTSRPETPIRLGFRDMSKSLHQDFVLHNISSSIVKHDITIFFQHRLGVIRKERGLPQEWPGRQTIEHLVQGADGLFIYAATACRFIQDSVDPEHRISLILQDKRDEKPTEKSPTWELDSLYTKVLEHLVIGCCDKYERKRYSDRFRHIVGSIVILSDSLSATALANLLVEGRDPLDKKEKTVISALVPLGTVLDIPIWGDLDSGNSLIRLLHPSFSDFLRSKRRCSNDLFYVDEEKAHQNLVNRCLWLMSGRLKRDVCHLSVPGALAKAVGRSTVKRFLPIEVQYACRYWVEHLEHLQPFQRDNVGLCDNGEVHRFLQNHLLHWLEALSLMGKMPEGVLMIRALQSMLTPGEHTDLLAMVHDAKRFILNYRSIIEEAPLQLYCSALGFSPKKSKIRREFWNQAFPWVTSMLTTEEDWNPSLQALEGHSGEVGALAFSPDGQLLTSASFDTAVMLWDPATGASRGTLEAHSEWASAVAFSPDGRLLACALDNATVMLWDPATRTLHGTLRGHSDWVRAVAFSPNGQLIASASYDTAIRLWDTATRALRGVLEGHSHWVSAVAFSPDDQLLASASNDWTIRLWDLATGASRVTLKGHSDLVSAVAFSRDCQLLASASRDMVVRLWDPATGASRGVLKGHSDSVTTVAFSPVGQLLASASYDKTVILWDLTTGASRGTLKGHLAHIWAVVFSPDGQVLASASDKTVRLWDPATVTSSGTLEGHSDGVKAVAFSPDGQLLASASYDMTVILWDPTTGASRTTLKGHSNYIGAVAFSPDGQLLASASYDRTVRLWNLVTGDSCGTLKGHSDGVRAVAFSPDGQLLASASYDGTVMLWDPATGDSRGILEGHLSYVGAVAFSRDGKLLASASHDRTVRLWDPVTGSSCGILEGHSDWVSAVAFSPDGQLLASASYDKRVQLWDIKAGEIIQELNTTAIVFELSFTSGGSHLVTDRGILELELPAPRERQSQLTLSSHLYIDQHWVICEKEKVLRLPLDYRTTCSAARKNILALGHASGRVTFLKFDPDSIPLASNPPEAKLSADVEAKLLGFRPFGRQLSS